MESTLLVWRPFILPSKWECSMESLHLSYFFLITISSRRQQLLEPNFRGFSIIWIPSTGRWSLTLRGEGCSGFQVTRMLEKKCGQKSKPQKIRLPAKPKNIMGPLLTSTAKKKKETLEAHSPWGWGWGEGHGPTLDGKALAAKLSERSYPLFKTSLTQIMSNALKHSLL